ncbi:hypothetical protein ACGFJ7_24775 [Actinoplanes sp. NPDC048988]|uniref:hypothetical protein n=1 Tax=Actinoplanes sp. NPDC048988 TaxID=3363901 RepID=UPI00371BCBC4
MIVASLLLILVAVALLVMGLTGGSSNLLISSIVASLLAAVFLVVGARQAASARRAAARTTPADEHADDYRDDLIEDYPDEAFVAEPEFAARTAGEPARRRRPSDDLPPPDAPFAAESGARDTVQFDAVDSRPTAHPADEVPPGDLSADEAHAAGWRDAKEAMAADLNRDPALRHHPGAAAAGRDSASTREPAFDREPADPSAGRDSAGPVAGSASADAAVGRGAAGPVAGRDFGDPSAGRDSAFGHEPAFDSDPALGGDSAVGYGPGEAALGREQPDTAAGRETGDQDIREADPDYDRASSAINAARSETPGEDAWRRDPGAATADDDEFAEPDVDDPDDEPLPQAVRPADAVRVARLDAEVLVVDGRPRYHLPDCPHLVGRLTEPIPVGEAVELGFSPCGLCRPVDRLVASAAHR